MYLARNQDHGKHEKKKFYSNSVEYILNDANFDNLSDEELLIMRDRISAWIEQPIDQRAMLGYAMNPLRIGKTLNKEIALSTLYMGYAGQPMTCCGSHGVQSVNIW